MNSLIMLFIIVPVLALLLLFLNVILAVHRPDESKVSAYECGFISIFGQTRSNFQIHFFLVALLFLVFDLEIILIMPVGVTLYDIGNFGFSIFVIFFIILTIGFVLEIGSGAIKFTSDNNNSENPNAGTTFNTTFNTTITIEKRNIFSKLNSFLLGDFKFSLSVFVKLLKFISVITMPILFLLINSNSIYCEMIFDEIDQLDDLDDLDEIEITIVGEEAAPTEVNMETDSNQEHLNDIQNVLFITMIEYNVDVSDPEKDTVVDKVVSLLLDYKTYGGEVRDLPINNFNDPYILDKVEEGLSENGITLQGTSEVEEELNSSEGGN